MIYPLLSFVFQSQGVACEFAVLRVGTLWPACIGHVLLTSAVL
jgi:hypothetical protein